MCLDVVKGTAFDSGVAMMPRDNFSKRQGRQPFC